MKLLRALAGLSLRRPSLVAGLLLLSSLLLAAGIPRIQRETTLRTFLGPDHEVVVTLDEHLETFGGGYPVVIAYSCEDTPACESVFDEPALRMAAQVASELRRQFGVRDVEGPANASLLVSRDGAPAARRFVSPEGVLPADLEELAARAVEDPLWSRNLTGQGGRVGALIVEVTSSRSAVQRHVAASIEEALAPWRDEGWRFYLVGELVDFVYGGLDAERDSRAMVPLMVAVLLAVLFLLLRSMALTVASLATMGVAFLWTQGAMGWASVDLNAITTVTPSLVFTIGILDSVHIVTHFSKRLWEVGDRSREGRVAALLHTTEEVGGACLFTSLTTSGAFLAFTASGIASFMEFGLLATWGILVALILSFTLLPIFLVFFPERWMRADPPEPVWRDLLGSTMQTVSRRRVAILGVAAVVSAVTLVGVLRVRVDFDPRQLAGETNRTIPWAVWLSSNLREAETLEVALTLPDGVSYAEPEVLDRVERFVGWLEQEVDGVGHAQSILGPLHRLNRLLHGDEVAFERHERERLGNSQLGLLLSMNDAGGLERWVASRPVDGSPGPRDSLRISAEAASMPTTRQAEVVRAIEEYLDDVLPAGWSYVLTGSVPMYLDMMTALERNQLLCFAIAGAVAFALMAVFFRSVVLALLALLPSVLACVLTVGLLGLWGYGLDPASTMVATIILGVAVDDGIHLLARFQQARRVGAPPEVAIEDALHHVGRAVIVSSLVLMASFWSLALSPSAPVASFGLLAGIAVLAALFADLFVLPSLICTSPVTRHLGATEAEREAVC